jgi:hypothetical protein
METALKKMLCCNIMTLWTCHFLFLPRVLGRQAVRQSDRQTDRQGEWVDIESNVIVG